ncbi:sulfotransferase domain-containing protein [Pontibacter sp. G13]|uniref:sulfotransferase domain-containing protein n=1 Tax=Pontibacter sp. G13 TaxID=3074898 RepID=UPI00288BF000|nr:sulfotransferase domain-containing protein [Pontibacter sp. G13]WNJ16794.1 sulfotransferase domain-containing protein [Pontibacter sp. G13]
MSTPQHMKPRYMIIGERKCGTSSLYRYLVDHPQVLPAKWKEPQFFSRSSEEIQNGFEQDYLPYFPLEQADGDIHFEWPELDQAGILYHESVRVPRLSGRKYITGEASANALHEADPAWVQHYLPDIKLIVVLRDPAVRAYSHHRMFHRFQKEGRDLWKRVGDFRKDLAEEYEAFQQGNRDEFYSPGLYLRNLKRWSQHFSRAQMLILFSDDLDTCPQLCLDRVCDHIGIERHTYGSELDVAYNRAPLQTMPETDYHWLSALYRTHDEALAEWLGEALPWRASTLNVANHG